MYSVGGLYAGELEWCILGSRLVCDGKQIGVLWEADWCVVGSRLVCSGKQIGIWWEAD